MAQKEMRSFAVGEVRYLEVTDGKPDRISQRFASREGMIFRTRTVVGFYCQMKQPTMVRLVRVERVA